MMKIKPNYINPYLGYEVNAITNSGRNIIIKGFDSYSEKVNTTTLGWVPINDIRLRLRPLTELTKRIEFNGKKVFPVDIIMEYCEYELITKKETLIEPPKMLPYVVFDLLCQMHFDMFDLLKYNLAIKL